MLSDLGRTHHSFDIVDMKEIPAEVFLDSPSDSERVLALLCQSGDPRETIRRVLGSWRHLPEKELLNNIDRLKTLCQLRGHGIMVGEEVGRMPFSIEAEMRESIFFKDACKLVRKDVLVDMLTRQLEHRFGPLPEREKQILATASVGQLETWVVRATDVHCLEDVFPA